MKFRQTMHRHYGLILAITMMSSVVMAQTYDFTAATSQLQTNLSLYGNRVIAIVRQGTRGEIFRFESGGLTQDSKLAIASGSKWLSGAIILICAERGYFKLDDRVGKYLPIFNTYGKGDITIRQCFAMNSGLSLTEPEYETDSTLTLEESVDLIAANTPVIFPPGTQLDYQGDGMQVAGRICEVVTGKDWRTLASEVLFTPLGMTNSDYLLLGKNPCIAGGARSTSADYLKFLEMILNKGQGTNGQVVLSSRSVQEFFINQTQDLPEYFSPWGPSLFFPYSQRPDYGMGSWILAQNPTNGVTEEVASPGAFGTFPWVDRKRGLCGIIFTFNLGGFSSTYNNNLHVLQTIREEIDAKGLPPTPDPDRISTSIVSGYLRLPWPGGGTMETSPDLMTWTALSWATSPFLESPSQSPLKLFYQVRQ